MQLLPLLERASRYALPLVAGAMLAGTAVAKDIRIAHVYSKTGALQAYGAQTQTGLMLGFDYATGGTMTVNGPGQKAAVKRCAKAGHSAAKAWAASASAT